MIIIDLSGWLEFFAPMVAGDLSEQDAVVAISAMQRTRVVPITSELALTAADLSLEHGLAMADAILLAMASLYRDFEAIPGVTYLSKP